MMPNIQSFPIEHELPQEPIQMGQTVLLRANGSDEPYIWRRSHGVDRWEPFDAGPHPPAGPAGGVLGGTYPNPTFAVPQATQAALTSGLATAQANLQAAVANYRVLNYSKSGVNMAVVADAIITGLPAKYRVEGVIFYSGSVGMATVVRYGLYTSPGGTGTALIGPELVNLPLNEVSDHPIPGPQQKLALTGAQLYLRITTPFVSPATASFQVTVRNLS